MKIKTRPRTGTALTMPLKLPRTNDWPRGMRLYVYDDDLVLIEESNDRKYDLHDNIFQAWPEDRRRVYIGFEVKSANWPVWNEKALRWFEERIEWDFAFDGDEVKLRRHTRKTRRPCSEEFIWRVDIQ